MRDSLRNSHSPKFAEDVAEVARGSAGSLRQRADHRQHLGVRVLAHRGVGAAIGQAGRREHVVRHHDAELLLDELDELGEYQTTRG